MARQLVVELVGEAGKFTKSLDDASKASKTFGDKVSSAGKKMSTFVSVPIVGFLGAATKAAMDDAAAQDHLAQTLTNVGETHVNVLGAVNDYIEGAQKASTFTDDELRPSFEDLVTVTGSAERAMDLLDVAMDVAAGKGIDLETATKAVARASEGQFAAVNKLVPGLIDLDDKTMTAEKAVSLLASTFSGHAQAATETTAGKMKNMTRDIGELTEKLGASLLPALTSLAGFLTDSMLPALDKVSGDNGALVLFGVAAAGPVLTAVGHLKTAVTGLNGALTLLAANPGLAAITVLATQLPSISRDVTQIVEKTKGKGVLAGLEEAIFGSEKNIGGTFGWEKIKGFLFPGTTWPKFAAGGVVPGTPGMPVPAVVHGGERIIPLRDHGGGGGGTVVNISVSGIGMGRDFGRAVADAMRENDLIGVT